MRNQGEPLVLGVRVHPPLCGALTRVPRHCSLIVMTRNADDAVPWHYSLIAMTRNADDAVPRHYSLIVMTRNADDAGPAAFWPQHDDAHRCHRPDDAGSMTRPIGGPSSA